MDRARFFSLDEYPHVFLIKYLVSPSAHQTPNFTNPEFQFPQFKMLQSVFSFYYSKLYWHFWVHFDINLGLLSGKNTQKVNKQNIRDS